MDLQLQGKVVLIVGASAGIGAALATLLQQEGAKLALAARRESALRQLAKSLGDDSVLALEGDAAKPEVLNEMVAQVVRHHGTLDRLVVIAGPMGARVSFHELSNADWDFYYRYNLMVAVQACRAAIPQLIKHSDAAIVLTAAYSIHAQKPELVAYTAMKSAIAALSKNLAKTYGQNGLRVNCVAPGVIEKDEANRQLLASKYAVPEERARYEYVRREFGMTVALERAGRHEEFADLMAYLLSARASYVTGAIINIDGGTDF